MIKIRFECGSKDLMSEEYGPFEYAQITYTLLDIGDGKFIALFDPETRLWYLNDSEKSVDFAVKDLDIGWSDVVIFASESAK